MFLHWKIMMMMLPLVVVVVVVMTGGDCNCDDYCYYGYWQKSTMTMVAVVVDMVIDLPREPPSVSVSASSDYYSHGPMDWSDSILDDAVTSEISFRNSDEDESL
jgi:hypothetical protein